MPINLTESFLRLLYEDKPIGTARRVVSLHSGPPGEKLANEVSYAGYARQPLSSERWTGFPQCVGGSCLVTHMAVSTSDGVALLVIDITPPVPVSAGVTPMVGFGFGEADERPDESARKWATQLTRDLETDTVDDEIGDQVEAMPGGRFAAVAAELGDDD